MKKTFFAATLFLCSILIASCGDSGQIADQQNQANTATPNPINAQSTSANQVKLDNQNNKKQPHNSTSAEKTPIKNNNSPAIANNNPSSGTIKDMQNGDLKCYISVVDDKGKLHESIGATFDVCEPDKYVNKNVDLSYELEDVNDCENAEPCGKTIKEWLITKITIRD